MLICGRLRIGIKQKPNRIFKGWKTLNEHDFKLPYQIYRGLDYGLSAKTALVCMKFDGDENYFFKEELYKQYERNEEVWQMNL
jgi:hypothetical protein